MELGIITGREIKKNRDGDVDRILLQVEIMEEDVRTVELITQSGEDTSPANGCRVFVIEESEACKYGIAVSDNLTPEVLPGEKEFYSTDNPVTSKLARIKLGLDSIVEINGNSDNAVRYSQYDLDVQDIILQINLNLGLIAADLAALGGSYAPIPIVRNTILSKVSEVKLP